MKIVSPIPTEAPDINIYFGNNQPDHIYNYCNRDGRILFYVCRWNASKTKGKKIFPYVLTENDKGIFEYKSKWLENPRVLYNLPQLLEENNKPVLIVEGEKAAEAGKTLFPDFVSTCSSAGSNRVNQSDFSVLENREVYISADVDSAGKKFQESVIELCQEAKVNKLHIIDTEALSKIIGLNECPEGFDIADALEAGITEDILKDGLEDIYKLCFTNNLHDYETIIESTDNKEELYSLASNIQSNNQIKNTFKHSLLKQISKKIGTKVELLKSDVEEDLGIDESEVLQIDIAKEFISQFGSDNIIYTKGSFFIYEDNKPYFWQKIEDRKIQSEVQKITPSENIRKNTVDSITDLIKSECYLPEHEFDKDREAITVLNGRLILEDKFWLLKPHDKRLFNLTYLPFDYDPKAVAPGFERFLGQIFEFDKDKNQKTILTLQAMGYSLAKGLNFEKFFILTGGGANGKSVLLNVLKALIGNANIAAVQLSQINCKFQRAHLFGKLANIVTETSEGEKLPDAEIKAVTSGERITVEEKYKPPFDFEPYCKLWFATNHLPITQDHSEAIYRRAIIIPFNRKFEEHQQDKHLSIKLRKELPGILNLCLFALEGLIKSQIFEAPESCNKLRNEWKSSNDHVEQFIEECCKLSPDSRVASGKIYKSYSSWCTENGLKRACNHKNFTIRLRKFGVESIRGTQGRRDLAGIRLLGGDASDI